MTIESRYNDLLNEIPTGPYYASASNVIPYSNKPTNIITATQFPNSIFLILVNGIQSGIVTTDVNGSANFYAQLPRGDVTIELQKEYSTEVIKTYVTTREYATWLMAVAEQFNTLDTATDAALNSFYLAKAGPTDIDLAHGVLLQYPNIKNAELEAYREILQLVRQSMRQFAGRLSGKYGVVSALTQVNPLILERYKDGPRWVLGYDILS